jgi:hypothetical protein
MLTGTTEHGESDVMLYPDPGKYGFWDGETEE